MVAFQAPSWKAVDDFHAAALAHEGACEGPPGLRLHYAPDFYAAYVRDPDGNKVAAVCRGMRERPQGSPLPRALRSVSECALRSLHGMSILV